GRQTRAHRAAGARIEYLAPVLEKQPRALAALDARIVEIEVALEDGAHRFLRIAANVARTLRSLLSTCTSVAFSAARASRASIASKIASCSPEMRRCQVSDSGSRLNASFSCRRISSMALTR